MLRSNNIIRYHRRSSKGFAGTQLEFRSFEVRSLVLYRPAAKHCSNKILQREHRSSKGFAGTQPINSRPAHPPFFTFLMCGFVYTASTVLASEGCWCTG